jgi:hypothetical protein
VRSESRGQRASFSHPDRSGGIVPHLSGRILGSMEQQKGSNGEDHPKCEASTPAGLRRRAIRPLQSA